MVWLSKLTDTHCSALIKLTRDQNDNINDIYVGHSTWDDYSEMLRTMKVYEFEFFDNKNLRAINITFSSYPGTITSTDDFYMVNN
jgi:hypothetical protein